MSWYDLLVGRWLNVCVANFTLSEAKHMSAAEKASRRENRLPCVKGAPAWAGEGLFFILDHHFIALANSRKQHKTSCPLFSFTQKVKREKLRKEKHRFGRATRPSTLATFWKRWTKTFNDYVCDIIKIKSVLGSDELSENTTLEKLLIMPFYSHKSTFMQ